MKSFTKESVLIFQQNQWKGGFEAHLKKFQVAPYRYWQKYRLGEYIGIGNSIAWT